MAQLQTEDEETRDEIWSQYICLGFTLYHEAVRDLAPKVKAMGFDILEISVENPDLIDVQAVKEILKENQTGRDRLWRLWSRSEYLQR